MKNLLYTTALKWSLISFGLGLLLCIPTIVLGGEAGMVLSVLVSVIGLLISLAVYVIACLDFSRKRNHQASTGEVFGLVGLMLLITLILSTVWGVLYYKFFFNSTAFGEIPELEDNLPELLIAQFGIGILFNIAACLGGIQLAGMWRSFQKAGKEGWESIIPIYNYMTMSEIGKNPSWWGLLMLIPVVNLVFAILILHGVSKAFGKDAGWTIGLLLLSFIFWPLLAWGGANYLHGNYDDTMGPDLRAHLVD